MRAKIIALAALIVAAALFYPAPKAEAQDAGLFTDLTELCLSLPGVIEGCIGMFIPIMAALVQGVAMLFSAVFAVAPDFFKGFVGGALVVLVPGYFVLATICVPFNLVSCVNIVLLMLGITSPFLILDIPLYTELVLGCVPAVILGIIAGIIQWTSTSPAESMGINTGRILNEGQSIVQIVQNPPPAPIQVETPGEGSIIQPRTSAGD